MQQSTLIGNTTNLKTFTPTCSLRRLCREVAIFLQLQKGITTTTPPQHPTRHATFFAIDDQRSPSPREPNTNLPTYVCHAIKNRTRISHEHSPSATELHKHVTSWASLPLASPRSWLSERVRYKPFLRCPLWRPRPKTAPPGWPGHILAHLETDPSGISPGSLNPALAGRWRDSVLATPNTSAHAWRGEGVD